MPGSAFERMLQAYQIISNIRMAKEENALRTRQIESQEQSNRISAQSQAAEKLRTLWGVIQAMPAEARPTVINSIAQQMGVDPAAFVQAASVTPEDMATVRNRKVAAGANSVSDAEVASSVLTGQNMGAAAQSNFQNQFLGTQGAAFGDVGKQAFLQSVARQGGMSRGEMAVDDQIPGMQPNLLRNAAAMRLGLMQTAPQAAATALGNRNADISNQSMENQYKLGFGNLQLNQKQLDAQMGGVGTWAPSSGRGGAGSFGPNGLTSEQLLDAMRIEQAARQDMIKGPLPTGLQQQTLEMINRLRLLQGLPTLSNNQVGTGIAGSPDWMRNIDPVGPVMNLSRKR